MKRYFTYALLALCLLASFSGVIAFEGTNNSDEIKGQESSQERIEPSYLAIGLTVIATVVYQFSRQKPEPEAQGEFLTDILFRQLSPEDRAKFADFILQGQACL